MKKLLSFLGAHIHFWRENYVLLPLAILALAGSSLLVLAFTGYKPRVDVEAIAGWCSMAVGVAIVTSLAGLAQTFLYGYRSEIENSFRVEILESCVTSFLLVLFSVLVFGLIR